MIEIGVAACCISILLLLIDLGMGMQVRIAFLQGKEIGFIDGRWTL